MKALRIVWWLTIPAAAALILLGQPAISLFLERGAFGADSTRLVYIVAVFFSLRIVSEASLEILARLFYAQHNTRTPMFAALGWLLVTIALFYLFVEPLGIAGLALASSIGFTLQSLALFLLNRRQLGSLEERKLLASLARAAIATAGMSLVILLAGRLIDQQAIFLLVGGLSGLAVYVGINLLLRSEELLDAMTLIRRKA